MCDYRKVIRFSSRFVSFPEIVKMESKVPFRVKMESLQKTTSGIFSRKFYYGSPGAGIGFSGFSANGSTLQGMSMSDIRETMLLPFIRAVYFPKDFQQIF
jgi:hypothetical protein